jgi:hypothetical protein
MLHAVPSVELCGVACTISFLKYVRLMHVCLTVFNLCVTYIGVTFHEFTALMVTPDMSPEEKSSIRSAMAEVWKEQTEIWHCGEADKLDAQQFVALVHTLIKIIGQTIGPGPLAANVKRIIAEKS